MSDAESLNRAKHQVIDRLLNEEYVLLHVAPKSSGACVPPHLAGKNTVTLKISRFFRGELVLKEEHITAQLLFNNEYFCCEIPLSAVWGVTGVDGKNQIWPESTPQEVMESIIKASLEPAAKKSQSSRRAPAAKKETHLKRVK